jgi:hypothetical protein
MKSVKIVEPFMLTHPDGRQQQFYPGDHEVDDDLAMHPYVIAHSDQAPPPPVNVMDAIADHARRRAGKIAALAQDAEQAKAKIIAEGMERIEQEMIDEEAAIRAKAKEPVEREPVPLG